MNIIKLLGKDIKDGEKGKLSSKFADFSYHIKKGHDVCGDSAFVYYDEKKAVVAVFDGVSGVDGAEQASSIAAISILNYLKNISSPNKDDLQEALVNAHANIVYGFTTALVVVIMKDGKFTAGSVGDSALYSYGKGKLQLELAPLRLVGEGMDFFRYMMGRNIVPNALGMPSDMEILFRDGALEKGDILLLATDGIVDNLKILTKENLVTDCSGKKDLLAIIDSETDVDKIVKKITDCIFLRWENKNVPLALGEKITIKTDDVAIVGIQFGHLSKVRRLSKKKGKHL